MIMPGLTFVSLFDFAAPQVGSRGGSHPRLALVALATLHTLAAFLTNYSMSQVNP